MQAERMDNSELRAQLEMCHLESYGWALSCCLRNPADADSVLQTVYVKVLEGKARFDGRAAFKTWLFSVIRKTAADNRRRQLLYRFKLISYEQGAARAAREPDPYETLYRSEVQELFRRALAALPRRQQEVLQLVFYHDLSLAEAAAVMAISLGSARTHYERGKKQLRKWMEGAKAFDGKGLGRKENSGAVP
jgi:RNA polymerase sigma-70 factor, ECF subfamily